MMMGKMKVEGVSEGRPVLMGRIEVEVEGVTVGLCQR